MPLGELFSEATANVLLTFAFVFVLGPVGPAVATFATLSVSNLLVVPWALRRQVPLPPWEFAKATTLGMGGGLLFAAATWTLVVAIAESDSARVLLAAILPTITVAGMAVLWLRDQGLFYRGSALILDGGFAVAAREAKEVREARQLVQLAAPAGCRCRGLDHWSRCVSQPTTEVPWLPRGPSPQLCHRHTATWRFLWSVTTATKPRRPRSGP